MMCNAVLASWKASLAPTTVYHRAGVLKRILRTLETYGTSPGCAALLSKIKRGQARPTVATQSQIEALLRHAPAWQRLFILLAWQLALRFAETFAVTPHSFNATRHTLTIRTKGDKVRTIPTTADVETMLAAAGDTQGRETTPYIEILRGHKTSVHGIRAAWWRTCQKAGITGLHPHDLRRTTASNLYATCKDLRAVQHFLGHDSLASTTYYLAPLTEEQLRDMHKLLNFHAREKETVQ
jgi:integrase/recombinase XerC